MPKSKVDANHNEIKNVLKQVGAFVYDPTKGRTPFDLIVAFRGRFFILEIKSTDDVPQKWDTMSKQGKLEWMIEQKVTENEKEFYDQCTYRNAPYHIVWSKDMALKAIGAIK